MAMGRDARRTVLVEVGAMRPFSDIAGRHILRFDGSLSRRLDLARRLEAAGCKVTLRGRDWETAGEFSLSLEDPTLEEEPPPPAVEITAHLRKSPTPGRGYLALENHGDTSIELVDIRFVDESRTLLLSRSEPLPYLVPGQRVVIPVVSLDPDASLLHVQLEGRLGPNQPLTVEFALDWDVD